jgi:hypothetical protein
VVFARAWAKYRGFVFSQGPAARYQRPLFSCQITNAACAAVALGRCPAIYAKYSPSVNDKKCHSVRCTSPPSDVLGVNPWPAHGVPQSLQASSKMCTKIGWEILLGRCSDITIEDQGRSPGPPTSPVLGWWGGDRSAAVGRSDNKRSFSVSFGTANGSTVSVAVSLSRSKVPRKPGSGLLGWRSPDFRDHPSSASPCLRGRFGFPDYVTIASASSVPPCFKGFGFSR